MKISKIKVISISILIILLLLCFMANFTFAGNISFAQPAFVDNVSGFNVSLYDLTNQGETLAEEIENTTYSNKPAHVFKWANTDVFHFNIADAENLNLNPKEDNEGIYYEISLSINYLQSYKEKNDFNQGGVFSSKPINEYAKVVRSLQAVNNYSAEFNFNDGITVETTTGTTEQIQGWGIYQFELKINEKNFLSDFYIIEPNQLVDQNKDQPVISMTIGKSEDTFETEYVFTLENEAKYQYIDKNRLCWYAIGKTQDGLIYCLTDSDLTNPKFKDCDKGLLENPERHNTIFKFKDDGHYGEWDIWCEYKAYDPQDSAPLLESNHYYFTTKKAVNYQIVIWIFLGVAAASILVTVVICVIKVKREKAY